MSYVRIGLISDTHIPEARKELWPQVWDAFRKVDYILHAGDIHDLSVIDRLSELAPTFAARGNGDAGSGGRPIQPDDDRLREAWDLELGGIRIAMTHELPVPEIPPHLTLEKALERHFKHTDFQVAIHGDTHVEDIREIGGVLCINPGSPTYPRNLETQMGTIGFLDIRDGVPAATIWMLTEDGHEPFDWTRWRRPW